MNQSFDVIVIGGGIVGLSAAIAMRQRNFSVALIDAGSLTVDTKVIDSRVYAINHASQSLLQRLGAWETLEKTRVSPYQHMHVWDVKNGAHIDFDARMVGFDRLGSIIEESVIKQALFHRLSLEGVITFPHRRVASVESKPDEICISNGTHSWHANLLIVADGAASVTRQLLGVPITSWPYHQQAIVTTIHTEKSHEHTAYQVFNADGPLAFLPLPDPHQCSIVWSTTSLRADALMSLPDQQFAEQLTGAFAAKLGGCAVVGARHQFPLHMRHAKRYSGPRWLLMGDAAHTIHPLAGLGLNVGLADLTAWLGILDMDKREAWSNKMLSAYQRQRKYHVWQMIALMESLKAIFANPLPPVAILRGLGLRSFNHLLPLKRWFIEQAAH